MNLIDGEKAARHGAHTIGIRPEHVAVSERDGIWSGRVGVAEHLVSDTVLHVHDTALADMLTVRVDGEVGVNHGDCIHLTPRTDAIHRFDKEGLPIP